ncbi:HAD-IA family hydrolase [archaeon]|jgi:HAD superfamily hydrolase (TIGR01548 family)|nr:HAD-IA family hydrolase [archaeon]MBT4351339.1 HAD-IA family hydrolase [archaeon]MBT4648064.1 HAD-IA family hydrolase [archaeon]MBT6822682.1 HAD-IA family hydrolase [archaeon]MBT7392425.1 HAD-IA family hydrolase [archaeon]
MDEEIDTIIFDMDGVLVDESKSYRLAIKKTAEFFLDNKKEISMDMIESYKERGGLNNDWDCTEAILKDNGADIDKEKIIEKFDDIYINETIKSETLIIRREILEELSKIYKLGIVTGRPKRDANLAIFNFNLARYFNTYITMEDVENQKPSPDGIIKCMKRLGSKKAIYFGDTIDDMRAAKSAGIIGIGVMPLVFSGKLKNLLIENGASNVLDNINEIVEVL